MTILFDVLLRVSRGLTGDIWEGIATPTYGSATTLIDSTANIEDDDWWNGGTLFFKTGATGRINTTTTITDFTKSTGTFTFATGTAIASAVQYLALTKAWKRSQLVQAVNNALQRQNVLSINDDLTASSSTTEYTLPTGVSKILRVQYGEEGAWTVSHYWKEEFGTLVFSANPPDDGTIVLHYLSKPAVVAADSDVISIYSVDLLVYDTLAELWHTRYMSSDQNASAKETWQNYAGMAEVERRRLPRYNVDARYTG
jgi:hypothetical protein